MENAELLKEKENYSLILKTVDSEIERILDKGNIDFAANTEVVQDLNALKEKELNDLKKVRNFLYFARIDYISSEQDETDGPVYYIGKKSITDEQKKMLVIDWRAPIAGLYYGADIGQVSYEAPGGTFNGELLLKRQYTIKDGMLDSFSDVTIATNDEILKEALAVVSDVRLKNIIATIQSEQNRVIRRELNKDIIVQGAAGSGKTTVAIHRMAFLVYTYKKALNPNKMLIIAPNRLFLNYISNILPDLDVEDIMQKTFEEFSLDIIGGKFEILNEYTLDFPNTIFDTDKYLSSFSFKDVVCGYLENFENMIINSLGDFVYCNNVLAKKEEIHGIYEQFKEYMSVKDRLLRVRDFLKKRVNLIIEREEQGFLTKNVKLSLSDLFALKKNSKKEIDSYIKQIKLEDVFKQYKKIIQDDSFFTDTMDDSEYAILKKTILFRLNKKKVALCDFPALLLIQHRIFGIDKELKPEYIVIDEAQDLGAFHFYSLKNVFKDSRINAFGDLMQGIYTRGISDWSTLNSQVFDGNAEIIILDKSYRTTAEIIKEANKVVKKLGEVISVNPATSILRSGVQVNYNGSFEKNSILRKIDSLRNTGMKNIAIIVRNNKDVEDYYNALKDEINEIKAVSFFSKNLEEGINIISCDLSKGLEFDSVILLDADKYGSNMNEGKLLYVAMTRAMHTLDIYNNENCQWLN